MCPDVTKKLNKFIDRQMKIGKPMVTFEVRDEDKRYILLLLCALERELLTPRQGNVHAGKLATSRIHEQSFLQK